MAHSTITVRADVKERLSVLKGDRSWDDFMNEVAQSYPADDVIREMEKRLRELRERKVQAVPWRAIKAERAARRK